MSTTQPKKQTSAFNETLFLIREDAPAVLLLAGMLGLVGWSVLAAGWVDGLTIMFGVALFALLLSYLLSISDFLDIFALMYSAFFGALTVWGLSAATIPNIGIRAALVAVVVRFSVWVEQAFTGGFSNDSLIFLLLMAFSMWYLTFNAVWNLFRVRRIWYATVPLGLMLVINNYYYDGPAPLELMLVLYLFLVFLMAAQTHMVDRQALWASAGLELSTKSRNSILRMAVLTIIVLIGVAWLVPPASAQNYLQEAMSGDGNPFNRVQRDFDRLFASVDGETAVTADYYATNSLSMSGPVDLTDNPVMNVSAPPVARYYWRAKTFDTYTDGRWVTSSEARIRSRFGRLRTEQVEPYALRSTVQQRFEVQLEATSLVYAAPQPVSFASLPVSYEVIFTAAGEDYATITKTSAQDVLRQGDIYSATSSLSIADENSLRAAGQNYPVWVQNQYLQLPETITPRTRALAEGLEQGNPYDTARTVELYVRNTISYNEDVPAPPLEVEPVDWVLFEQQEGYCTYYASSMTVLLRSLGIPARLSAGFAQGEFDPVINAYRVAESDAHVWVEVFFPGYGWVEFEPTASENPIQRPESSPLTEEGIPEVATPTPTPAPTQEAPSQATEEAPPEDQDEAAVPPPVDETNTPGRNFPIVIVLIIFAVLLTGPLLLLIAWYVLEQHGLHGVSEVSRSYARLNTAARLLGIRFADSSTPYERADQIKTKVPASEELVERIVQLYVEQQYAEQPRMDKRRLSRTARRLWEKTRPVMLKAILEAYMQRFVPDFIANRA